MLLHRLQQFIANCRKRPISAGYADYIYILGKPRKQIYWNEDHKQWVNDITKASGFNHISKAAFIKRHKEDAEFTQGIKWYELDFVDRMPLINNPD